MNLLKVCMLFSAEEDIEIIIIDNKTFIFTIASMPDCFFHIILREDSIFLNRMYRISSNLVCIDMICETYSLNSDRYLASIKKECEHYYKKTLKGNDYNKIYSLTQIHNDEIFVHVINEGSCYVKDKSMFQSIEIKDNTYTKRLSIMNLIISKIINEVILKEGNE